ncbi:MAG: hypothetical protein WC880_04115 [Candidatus Paceibacterota bacterium]
MSESLDIERKAPKGKATAASELLTGKYKRALIAAGIGNNVLFFGGITALMFGLSHGNVPLAWAGGAAALTALTVSATVTGPRVLSAAFKEED